MALIRPSLWLLCALLAAPVAAHTSSSGSLAPSVRFTVAASQALEDAGTLQIEVRSNQSIGQPIVIPFVLGGTASQGADYQLLTSSPVVIAPGQITTIIQVSLLDDNVDEVDEVLTITLQNPPGAQVGSPGTHTLTIGDNDGPELYGNGPTIVGPSLSIEPQSLFLSGVQAGEDSLPTTVTISNNQSVPLQFERLVARGAHRADFSITHAAILPLVLQPGQSTSAAVTFSPTGVGQRSADLLALQNPPIHLGHSRVSGFGYGLEGDEVLVNCGGSQYVQGGGAVWASDYAYYQSTSQKVADSGTVNGSSEQVLHRSGRKSQHLKYDFPLSPGTYGLELAFAEFEATAQGQNIFSVWIEGNLVANGLDVFNLAGGQSLYLRNFEADLSDGVLNLELISQSGSVVLRSLRIGSIIDDLAVSPQQVEFGIIPQENQVESTVVLTNTGQTPLSLKSLEILVSNGLGSAHDFDFIFNNVTYTGAHTDQTFPLAKVLGPGASLPLKVVFRPHHDEANDFFVLVESDRGTALVNVSGQGGEGSGHFLHVVIVAPGVVVDYDGNGSEPAPLVGNDSHTHEFGRELVGFQWKDGGTTIGSAIDVSPNLALGQHPISLTITDNDTPPKSLTGFAQVGVHAPTLVPGYLATYYEGQPAELTSWLTNPPSAPDFQERIPVLPLGLGGEGVGGSPYATDVLVRLQGTFFVSGTSNYQFTAVGGANRRLYIDGLLVTSVVQLSSGSHSFDLRVAVQLTSQLPINLRVSVNGGAAGPVPGGVIHDQSALLPLIHDMPTGGTVLGGNNIRIEGFGFFPYDSVVVRWGGLLFDSSDFTKISAKEIEFLSPASGPGSIAVTVETPNGVSNARTFTYALNGPVPFNFTHASSVPLSAVTCGEWGPDGRLYVGAVDGKLYAIDYSDDYKSSTVQTYDGVSNLTNANILGLAFNPWSDPTGPVEIYVAHGSLYQHGGVTPTTFSWYTGEISLLSAPTFDAPTVVLNRLPVSNHDHGINDIEFDNNGDLLICSGGMTNAGVPSANMGELPASPFSGAILKALLSKPGFQGFLSYVETSTGLENNDQRFGDLVDPAPGVDLLVHAAGLRNPYSLAYTTKGQLYSTDNGPNSAFGPSSTGPTTVGPSPEEPDDFNVIEKGSYYGHPNRNRGRTVARENVFRSPSAPWVPGQYAAPIGTFAPSTNGIDEYRATSFGSQLRGDLIVQKWNDVTVRVKLYDHGRGIQSLDNISPSLNALDVLTAPGGALVGVNYTGSIVEVIVPDDPIAPPYGVVDIFPWRAPASGGSRFEIAGYGFGTLFNTTVTLGGQQATLVSITPTRIVGIVPQNQSPTTQMLSVTVTSGGQIAALASAFRYLYSNTGQEPGQWLTSGVMPVAMGEVTVGLIGTEYFVVGESSNFTLGYNLSNGAWRTNVAIRPHVGHHHAGEVIDGKWYLIGGLSGGSEGKVQIFDPVNNTWSLGANMPWQGGSVSTATINGKIYAAGGIQAGTTVDNTAVYDPQTNAWTTLANLPANKGRNHAAGATDGQRFYIFGGRGIGSGAGNFVANGFNSVHVYNPANNTWNSTELSGSSLTPMPIGRGGMGRALFYQGEFYVFGGETLNGPGAGPMGTYDRVDVYNPASNTWRTDSPMPTARHGIYPLLVDSRIYLVGGGIAAGFSSSDKVEVFTRQ